MIIKPKHLDLLFVFNVVIKETGEIFMSKMWSQFVQSSEELYASRSIRFREDNKDMWLNAMKLKDGMKILELGCGSGIFCHRIKTFLPNSSVTGLDRDEGHIEFAIEKSKQQNLDCAFVLGDVLSLPFEDNSFDACTSYTVVEHVETNKFLSEQYRILRTGGVISVVSVRTNMNVSPENWRLDKSGEEADLLNKAWSQSESFGKENKIGFYEMKESEFPIALAKAGFDKINADFFAFVSYAPDNENVSREQAIQQINTNRIHALTSMRKALNISPNSLTEAEVQRLNELINQRYDERISIYLSGKKLWDIASSCAMVITGYKL